MIAPTIVAIASAALAAPDAPRPAREAPSIRFAPGSAASPPAVEVVGLDPESLAALAKADWDFAAWSSLLAVSIEAAKTEPTPIPGRYRVAGGVVRFEPKFPIEPGLSHRARFRPSNLPGRSRDPGPEISLAFAIEPPRPVPTAVLRVEPSGDVLPENLLKFYLHFSAPMGRGEAYGRVRLLDASGKALEVPFLELGEELWDPTGTRLTLLLDPGRIKRGLKPREEDGPILESGKAYRLVVDREWPDAAGRPLREPFRKGFRAGPADEEQPDPKGWTLGTPAASTRDPLTLAFPEPLDRAMLDRSLVVRDAEGRAVSGRVEVAPRSTRWRFRPDAAWVAGAYRVEVDPELEDLAGNSVARPFEVDRIRPIEEGDEPPVATIPVTIREARRP